MEVYSILYKLPTEACVPHQFGVAVVQSQDRIMDNLPKMERFSLKLWKGMGAPVRLVGHYADGEMKSVAGSQVVYLTQSPDAKAKAVKRKPRKRRNSPAHDVTMFFVSHCLNRAMTRADYGGMVMKHASQILGLGYTAEEIKLCLERMKRGDLTEGVPWRTYTEHYGFKHTGFFTPLCVLWGEPPMIEREPNVKAMADVMTHEAHEAWKAARKAESPPLEPDTPESIPVRDWSKKGNQP